MIIGLTRVKDEAHLVTQCLRSMAWTICNHVAVFDDASGDVTAEICRREGAVVVLTPFAGHNETRDKCWLLRKAYEWYGPFRTGDYAIMLDGDEELPRDSGQAILDAIVEHPGAALKLRIWHLWDSPDSVRVDGCFGNFWRPSVFPLDPTWQPFINGGNVPARYFARCIPCDAAVIHHGYLTREDRIRRFHRHRENDPDNAVQQGYIHIPQGDIPKSPADAKFMWGGPLECRPLEECLEQVSVAGRR